MKHIFVNRQEKNIMNEHKDRVFPYKLFVYKPVSDIHNVFNTSYSQQEMKNMQKPIKMNENKTGV